jgi:hypothetical protein
VQRIVCGSERISGAMSLGIKKALSLALISSSVITFTTNYFSEAPHPALRSNTTRKGRMTK